MAPAEQPVTRRMHRSDALPGYVFHPSFDAPTAARDYAPDALADSDEYETRYMPDEVTREHAKRMHYAAHRMHTARTAATLARWQRAYLRLRDRVVLGNRKLVYRAVRRRMATSNRAEDTVGDCHIVLIQAVAAFNPWLSIRFSTYAFTCLIRAVSRMTQRWATDSLARALPLDALPDGEPGGPFTPEPASSGSFRLDDFLRDDHPLLSDREKAILVRRFSLTDRPAAPTLEQVGAELGLSKERVRQVQAAALTKLRQALTPVAAH